ncbi:MAG TPA: SWIB/MDM2 domain-containing protein [Gemmatimonadaceae bacterium]|nr:SWIB/MDM2 domain-containing protein [Gemmatimonadaceae bacterium]
MRRIVAFNNVSADGYFAAPDGKLDWVVPDEEMDRYTAEAVGRGGTDTILFGRKTYQMFASFWPHVLDESGTSADPHTPGRRSAELRAMAVMLNETPKIVFSGTLKEATWQNTQIVRKLDPREIGKMKQQRGQDMMIFGSSSIVSLLARHHLIDEYQFAVSPVLLGGGRTLVNSVPVKLKLDLEEEKRFPSGKLLLRYTLAEAVQTSQPEVEDVREVATKAPRKTAPRPEKVAAAELLHADAALAKIVGNQPMSRNQGMNALLSYIKRKGLQDKQNRRMINADDALRPVFGGKSQVNMVELPGLVDKHLKSKK